MGLMARKISNGPGMIKAQGRIIVLAWALVERVTRIGLALSVWEAARSRLATALNCRLWRSGLTVADPSSPWLMAR